MEGTVKTTGETDRFAAFEMRLERCSRTIAEAFRALKMQVEGWPGVTTKIDSKLDGMTFYRDDRRFFRLDPKHSARVDNIGVAFFGLTHEEVRTASGIETREELKQDGVWIFIHDETHNAALVRLARQAYDRLS